MRYTSRIRQAVRGLVCFISGQFEPYSCWFPHMSALVPAQQFKRLLIYKLHIFNKADCVAIPRQSNPIPWVWFMGGGGGGVYCTCFIYFYCKHLSNIMQVFLSVVPVYLQSVMIVPLNVNTMRCRGNMSIFYLFYITWSILFTILATDKSIARPWYIYNNVWFYISPLSPRTSHRFGIFFNILDVFFKGQTDYWPYLIHGRSDWHKIKRKCIDWILGQLCDLHFWPYPWHWPWIFQSFI